jgi:hypothetical protein
MYRAFIIRRLWAARLTRWLAVPATLMAIGGGLLTASPASAADIFNQVCNYGYAGTEICISYDYTDGNTAINVDNGSQSSLYADLQIIYAGGGASQNGITISPVSWYGFSHHLGVANPGQICGYLYYAASGAYIGGACGNF